MKNLREAKDRKLFPCAVLLLSLHLTISELNENYNNLIWPSSTKYNINIDKQNMKKETIIFLSYKATMFRVYIYKLVIFNLNSLYSSDF